MKDSVCVIDFASDFNSLIEETSNMDYSSIRYNYYENLKSMQKDVNLMTFKHYMNEYVDIEHKVLEILLHLYEMREESNSKTEYTIVNSYYDLVKEFYGTL